jgi:hydrogenase maturation protease
MNEYLHSANGPILLIGVGNEYRSDDGVGLFVVRDLHRRFGDELRIIEHSGEGASLMEAWNGVDAVLLVDAVVSGEPAGFVHRIDVARGGVPARFACFSSHAFGVVEAFALARELHRLPPVALLYGVEGESFDTGAGLSNSVVKSIPILLGFIEHDLHMLGATLCTPAD